MKIPKEYQSILKAEMIEIPSSVVTFFKTRGKYLPLQKKGEEEIPVTFSSIVGEDAEEIPSDFVILTTSGYTSEYVFTNKDEENIKTAERAVIKAIKAVFGNHRHYDTIRRSYLVGNISLPIKVNYKVDGEKTKETLYVKRPDTNRIMGRFFYDIISGIDPIKCVFNKGVFLEEGIHGNLVARIDEDIFLQMPAYRKGLVRAAVHADFLQLYGDVKYPKNRIIDSQMRTVLFDFNLLFEHRDPKNSGSLLLGGYLQKKRLIFDEALFGEYRREHHRVVERVAQHEKEFFKFAKIAGILEGVSGVPLDERVRRDYGAHSLEEYFKQKLEDYNLM